MTFLAQALNGATTHFTAIALLALTGCSALTPERRAQWSATGSWFAQKTAGIALSTVIGAAQSRTDASQKADWLDSLATGVRAQGPSLISSDDFRAVAAIWAPQKPHWQELAGQLGALGEKAAGLPPEQRVEAVAVGLQAAAAQARTVPSHDAMHFQAIR